MFEVAEPRFSARCTQIHSKRRRWAIRAFRSLTRRTATSSVWTCGTPRIHWVRTVSSSTSGFLARRLPPTTPGKPSWYIETLYYHYCCLRTFCNIRIRKEVIVRPLSAVGYTSVVASVIHSRQWSN